MVTHAGVHALAGDLPAVTSECAAEINDRWHRRVPGEGADPLFDWRGPARGGGDPFGGIFWTHPSEWSATHKTPWGQVTGMFPSQSRVCCLVLAGRGLWGDATGASPLLSARPPGAAGARWLCEPSASAMPSPPPGAGTWPLDRAARALAATVGRLMAEVGIERELKLSVWPGYGLPDLGAT